MIINGKLNYLFMYTLFLDKHLGGTFQYERWFDSKEETFGPTGDC